MKQHDIFAQAEAELLDIARAERRRLREARAIENIDEHLRELRVEQRESVLPHNRHCPRCLEQKLDPQQWVVLVDGQAQPKRWRIILSSYQTRADRARRQGKTIVPLDIEAICKSCTMVPQAESRGNPFTPVVYWNLDSRLIKRRRYALNLTGDKVSEVCGWSQAKQSKMESRTNYMISNAEAEALRGCLDLKEIPVVGDPDVRYLINPKKLMALRQAAGASRRIVASWFDATPERVRHLEHNTTCVKGRIARSIVRGFARMMCNDTAVDGVIDGGIIPESGNAR